MMMAGMHFYIAKTVRYTLSRLTSGHLYGHLFLVLDSLPVTCHPPITASGPDVSQQSTQNGSFGRRTQCPIADIHLRVKSPHMG